MNDLIPFSNKYFKTATLNSPMSQRTERILALIFIPISAIILAITIISFVTLTYSTVQYFRFVDFKKEYQSQFQAIKHEEEQWKIIHPNDIRLVHQVSINLIPYEETGLDGGNIDPADTSVPTRAIDLQTDRVSLQITIIILCSLGFAIPWLCIRTFYWIKTADKTITN